MMVVVQKVQKPATLTHPMTRVQYDFRPLDGESVEVAHKTGRSYLCYVVPVAEARDLYRRLLGKGYEPW